MQMQIIHQNEILSNLHTANFFDLIPIVKIKLIYVFWISAHA